MTFRPVCCMVCRSYGKCRTEKSHLGVGMAVMEWLASTMFLCCFLYYCERSMEACSSQSSQDKTQGTIYDEHFLYEVARNQICSPHNAPKVFLLIMYRATVLTVKWMKPSEYCNWQPWSKAMDPLPCFSLKTSNNIHLMVMMSMMKLKIMPKLCDYKCWLF